MVLAFDDLKRLLIFQASQQFVTYRVPVGPELGKLVRHKCILQDFQVDQDS